jgi:hypothetical protein
VRFHLLLYAAADLDLLAEGLGCQQSRGAHELGSKTVRRAIDHLVLCVSDLERARSFYDAVGFTLTPRASHPFGTANSLAQLQGNFIELLAVAEPAQIPIPSGGQFSFGAYNASFLQTHQGMSMLALQSGDARRDQREFSARGLGSYNLFEFSRKAPLPDGSEADVSFSLAFLTHPAMPVVAFFVCQQHAPQYFWKREYQHHANGAMAIVEVLMVADRPAQHAEFFRSLFHPSAVAMEGSCIRIALEEDAALVVLDPGALRKRCPAADRFDMNEGARFAGYSVAVQNMPVLEAMLGRASIPFRKAGRRLQIMPQDAFGTIIEFTERTGRP